jgi:ABC-type antimicrobial peptide transport system permease subunit
VHEIVGIVGDMRYRRVESPADPTFYVPITQNRERWPFLSFTVWSDADPALTTGLLREAIRAADPVQAITRVRTFDEILASSLAPRRFNTLLVAAFATAALLLAAVGTFGVMAYSVSVRTRELGLRAALGATPGQLQQLVLGQGARLVGVAVAIGVAAALGAAGVLSGMLYGVAPRDPATLAAVAGVLAVVALAATWLPARRAVRIDPAVALRDS